MRALGVAFCAVLLACSSPGPGVVIPDAGAVEALDAKVETPDSGVEAIDATATEDAAVLADATPPEDAARAPEDSGTVEPPDAGMANTDGGVGSMYGPYAADGIETFTTMTVALTVGGRTFDEHIYLPDSPGPHPVVVFAPGTQQPSSSYEMFFQRLASWGIIVLSENDPGVLGQTQVVIDDVIYLVTTWLPAQNADAASPFFGRVDLARVGLSGHSRGGKATLLAAEGALKGHVLAYFGVDTIDTTFYADGLTTIPEVGNVGIPTLFLVAEIEGRCSPAAANGQVIYASASTPSILLLAIQADHTDFATPCVGCLIACGARTATADPATVRDYSTRYFMAFFARELLGDTTVGPVLEGAGTLLDEAAGLVAISSK
jgi:dienelactone hydrolase